MDKVKILATFLVVDAPLYIARARGGDLLQQLDRLPKVWDELVEEFNRLDKELKEAKEYFYQDGGSIYMDYKKLKEVAVSQGGMRKAVSRFRDNMTKDEIVQTAEAIIGEWMSSSGKERKT